MTVYRHGRFAQRRMEFMSRLGISFLYLLNNMVGLGPLFEEKAIVGPCVVQYFIFSGMHIYLIGEIHKVRGNSDKNISKTAVDQLRVYSRIQSRPVVCYCESSPQHALYGVIKMEKEQELMGKKNVLEVAESPVYGYLGYSAQDKLKNTENVYADIRNYSPYDLYTLIMTPDIYMLERYGIIPSQQQRQNVRRWAKVAEKVIVQHITTRDKTKAFLLSLCLPELDYPEWFIELYKTIHETTDSPPAPLRDMMRQLRQSNMDHFVRVVGHIRHLHRRWNVSPFTAAMKRVESMQLTRDKHLVAENNSIADGLLIELSAFLFDTFVITDILVRFNQGKFESGDTVVMFAGAKHTENITLFFKHQLGCDAFYKYDKEGRGNIPEGEAIVGPVGMGNFAPNMLVALKNKLKHRR